MSLPDEAASALRATLSAYTDPFLGQTLGQAKAIGAVSVQGNVATIELKLGFPCADYASELKPALESHLESVLGGVELNLVLRSEIMAHAVQRTLKPLTNVK